ncbi:MAG TPA: hypothetical protein VKY86_10260 [Promicromonospora sp.]|nr:hypothetical protein [Promicromonospora sp.]
MSQPDRWRDLLDPRYDYPEDVEQAGDGMRRGARRAARRQARREYRKQDAVARRSWIEARARDGDDRDTSRGRAVLLGLIALIVAIGMLVTWLRGADGGEPGDGAPATVEATATLSAPPTEPSGADQAPTTATATTTSPSTAPSSASAAEASPVDVAAEWAGAWFNYDPEQHEPADRIEAVRPLVTEQLAQWLSTEDRTANHYETTGAVLALDSAQPGDAEAGAPVDTDLRATVQLVVSTTTTEPGGSPQATVLPYVVTLERPTSADAWLVSWFEQATHE